MLWQILARIRGFKAAIDVEDGHLVVWHPKRAIHFNDPNAWRDAAKS